MESFETEFQDTQKAQLRRRKKGGAARRRRLEPALQGLMGEANLRFAKGDTDTAERMCMEVIRQDPTAPEPFQTLATLYEEQGELERSLQFGLLAAHLAPQDGEEWARLADMSLEQGQAPQAADCYRKAIEAEPANTRCLAMATPPHPTTLSCDGLARYHFTRAALLEQMGDRKAAVRAVVVVVVVSSWWWWVVTVVVASGPHPWPGALLPAAAGGAGGRPGGGLPTGEHSLREP